MPGGDASQGGQEGVTGGKGNGPWAPLHVGIRGQIGRGPGGGLAALGAGALVLVGPVALQVFRGTDEDEQHGEGAQADGQDHAHQADEGIGLESGAPSRLLVPPGVCTVRDRLGSSGGRRGGVRMVGRNVH